MFSIGFPSELARWSDRQLLDYEVHVYIHIGRPIYATHESKRSFCVFNGYSQILNDS